MAINNRIGRRVRSISRLSSERFNPNAIDGDDDGKVQEGTAWERPAIARNKKIQKRRLAGNISQDRPEQSLAEALNQAKASKDDGMPDLVRLAHSQGFRVMQTPGNHIAFYSPDKSKSPVVTSSSRSELRGWNNFLSELKKAGLVLPHKSKKKKEKDKPQEEKKKVSEEKLKEVMRYIASSKSPKDKLTLNEMAELLDIPEEEVESLRELVNSKFGDYFDSPKSSRLQGNIGIGRRKSRRSRKNKIVPESLVNEAQKAGVNLDAILDTSDFDNDVKWSSNSWSYAKNEVQQAGDAIIIRTNKDGEKEVLMIRRKTPPFTDGYTLPGGLMDPNETFEQTVAREMEEEVGISESLASAKKYLGEIKAKDWDPRFVEGVRVGATRYDIPSSVEPKAGSDAKKAEWVSIKELAEGKYRLGFGHAAWLSVALEKDDPELALKFDILARASRHRNQEIIRRVNEKRKKDGQKLFTGLGSPNKHYVTEGSGLLGMKKTESLDFDLAKMIKRNPGFFDKTTEEMFIFRASNSSEETAKKFGITKREVNDKLREASLKLEKKIRKDISDRIEKQGRKKDISKLSGSISSGITGSDPIDRAEKKLKLNDRQRAIVTKALSDLHESFETGEIYDMPIHQSLEPRKKELLDSIRIEIASDGTPMIMAEPNPLVTPYHAIERDWASIEIPTGKPVRDMIMEIMSNQNREAITRAEGTKKFYSYLYDITDIEREKGGGVEYQIGGDTSWPQGYIRSIRDFWGGHVADHSDGLHDLFGHFGTGRGYDYHGEWANYLSFKDMIEKNDVGLSKEELEGLNRFWLKIYGVQHVVSPRGENDELLDLLNGDVQNLMEAIDGYSKPIQNILDIIDTGRNGLGGVSGSKFFGNMSSGSKAKQKGKKIKDTPVAEFTKIVLDDIESRANTRANTFYPGPLLSGNMGVLDDDDSILEYLDFFKKKMTKDEWDGEKGEKARDLANSLYNPELSDKERMDIADQLLDMEVEYTSYDEVLDDFDYEAEEANSSDDGWNEYLEYLKTKDKDEYDFWSGYDPENFMEPKNENVQPGLFDDMLQQREISPSAKKRTKKSKRKKFGIFGTQDKKPSKYINKTKYFGADKVKDDLKTQLTKFKKWKDDKKWKDLHNSHYDWWTFPIDRGSAAYGDGYNVAGENRIELMRDRDFMSNLREAVEIYSEAMGWDLNNSKWMDDIDWDNGQDPLKQAYGARLYKIARSLQVFEMDEEFDSFMMMVQSLRTDESIKRRIGKSEYWDSPNIPINKITPGKNRRFRRGLFSGNISSSVGSSSGNPMTDKQTRFIREISIDDWFIFLDDMADYFEKTRDRNSQISSDARMNVMKAVALIQELEVFPMDNGGISLNMNDQEIIQLRKTLKSLIESKDYDFFNISEVWNSLPTKQKPKIIGPGE
jgi:8-oxo-dGTP diphosphatase